jgi:integrase
MPKAPIKTATKGLRQRCRSDGTWRIWWEPNATERAAGLQPVALSADRPTWSLREAERLNTAAAAALAGQAAPPRAHGARTMDALIEDYLASPRFAQRAATTQATYRELCRRVAEKWGPEPVAHFSAPVMVAWYETLYRTKGPHRAAQALRMASILFRRAEALGWRAAGSNPCAAVDVTLPPGRRRVGTWAELDALLRAARTRPHLRLLRVAILLVLYGGQRQTDILKAVPADFAVTQLALPGWRDPRRIWVWGLVRSKRGNAGAIALNPAVVPALRAAMRLARRGPGTLIWDERTGQAYTSRHLFAARWQELRQLAAAEAPSVATLQWRDLRRTFGHLARVGGADKGDVADVLGNTADTNSALAAVYMAPSIATTLRATSAIRRPEEARRKG